MPIAKQGDTVTIHVTEKLEDGTELFSTKNRDPLNFTIGDGEIIPGLEKAVIGMKPGERTTEKVSPDQAFGPYADDFMITIDRNCISPDIEPEVGKELYMGRRGDDQKTRVRILEVSDKELRIDMNHPMAGKDLIFDIELISLG